MNYPIPSHIKEFFQLADSNNSEYKVKGKLKCSCGTENFNVYQSNNKMIVKATCKKCNKEISIFDDGKHGWNGFVCKYDSLDRTQLFEKVICEKCKKDAFVISMEIYSQGKQDFIDECVSNDDSFSEEDWVDGFEWICISLSCEECSNHSENWMEHETM
ncbi:hypothetical protein [Clostridium beijerinckii]|uniref:Uncharacterized protein n=1 Tax=Clostridium beijerinckii TaxID=1520 RepID=A0A1S9N790_CLOBE|nr:hypothetical protein [Clostridium beijerinckii]MZK49960.1 hypothetical protein [Clostridium beijerinckii]MZK58242.1 hypothetical protein [Clostridium beijerinckii]MZK69810.1 hypothetical protein [Clostridium beijerinckii]MZK75188.1 hypothetical protein [Clostridium beijerinckii]MZK83332.1 hypothetical protein [Clostridium beijerinckii]